jgi:hypothetical protein
VGLNRARDTRIDRKGASQKVRVLMVEEEGAIQEFYGQLWDTPI